MRFDIVTIFPGFFAGIFEHGIVRRAQAEERVTIGIHDLRNFTHDRHRTVDDRPFGGGEGMVLKPEPLAEALASLGVGTKAAGLPASENAQAMTGERVILLSAQGRPFTQAVARELAADSSRIVLLCGRYEGVDERINELYCDMELSIGDYVFCGGELAAAVVVDAVMRLVPGVLGNEASSEFESFGVADAEIEAGPRARDRARSTAPEGCSIIRTTRGRRSFEGLRVPEVLDQWRSRSRFGDGGANSSCARRCSEPARPAGARCAERGRSQAAEDFAANSPGPE